ncbi:MurR/RpiR family transcriptional regulator [Enterococcus sp. LJL99]
MDIEIITKGKALSKNELSNLEYLYYHIEELEGVPLKDISKLLFTSPSTIVRLAQKLDFSGYLELAYFLKSSRATNSKLTEATIDYKLDTSSIDPLIQQMKAIYREDENKFILVYAAGFSSILAEYLCKKMLVNGIKIIFVTSGDSSGIILNNLEVISMFITISKSGETPKVIDKMIYFKESKVPIVLLTGKGNHSANDLAEIIFEIEDERPLDTQNIGYNSFFGKLMLLIEYMVEEFKK